MDWSEKWEDKKQRFCRNIAVLSFFQDHCVFFNISPGVFHRPIWAEAGPWGLRGRSRRTSCTDRRTPVNLSSSSAWLWASDGPARCSCTDRDKHSLTISEDAVGSSSSFHTQWEKTAHFNLKLWHTHTVCSDWLDPGFDYHWCHLAFVGFISWKFHLHCDGLNNALKKQLKEQYNDLCFKT